MLGICVGMQLLFESSEEGEVPCLGLLPGRVRRFADRDDLPGAAHGLESTRVRAGLAAAQGHPARRLRLLRAQLFEKPVSPLTVATATYGEPFSALVQSGNVFGVQFHPERWRALAR